MSVTIGRNTIPVKKSNNPGVIMWRGCEGISLYGYGSISDTDRSEFDRSLWYISVNLIQYEGVKAPEPVIGRLTGWVMMRCLASELLI